jgi:hypothetical protein
MNVKRPVHQHNAHYVSSSMPLPLMFLVVAMEERVDVVFSRLLLTRMLLQHPHRLDGHSNGVSIRRSKQNPRLHLRTISGYWQGGAIGTFGACDIVASLLLHPGTLLITHRSSAPSVPPTIVLTHASYQFSCHLAMRHQLSVSCLWSHTCGGADQMPLSGLS